MLLLSTPGGCAVSVTALEEEIRAARHVFEELRGCIKRSEERLASLRVVLALRLEDTQEEKDALEQPSRETSAGRGVLEERVQGTGACMQPHCQSSDVFSEAALQITCRGFITV